MKNVDLSLIKNPSFFYDDLIERFLRAAMQIADFGRQINIRIVPTNDTTLPLFRSLPLQKKADIVQKLEKSCAIYSGVVRKEKNLQNSASMVWMACNSFGLRPASDFFDKLSDTDIIQVYSHDMVHLFSNLNFFDICSYSIEQMYCSPWPELWQRDEADMAAIYGAVMKSLEPEQRTSFEPQNAPHRVREIASPFRYETEYRMKCISPLFSRETREKTGFIVCEEVTLLSKHAPQDEERLLEIYESEKNLDNVVSLSSFKRF